jgi:hypothetical protein
MEHIPQRFSVAKGHRGEQLVYQQLVSIFGRDAHKMSARAPYDLIVDGIRVDVKTGFPRRQYAKYDLISWQFYIYKDGASPKIQPDCYVLRLEDLPYSKHAMHLVCLAPIQSPTINISIASLLKQRWAKEYQQWIDLTQGKLKIPNFVPTILSV